MGQLMAEITRWRDKGILRATMGQHLLDNGAALLKTSDPGWHTYIWQLFTVIYDDTQHRLTPAVIQAEMEDACIRRQLNALAK